MVVRTLENAFSNSNPEAQAAVICAAFIRACAVISRRVERKEAAAAAKARYEAVCSFISFVTFVVKTNEQIEEQKKAARVNHIRLINRRNRLIALLHKAQRQNIETESIRTELLEVVEELRLQLRRSSRLGRR